MAKGKLVFSNFVILWFLLVSQVGFSTQGFKEKFRKATLKGSKASFFQAIISEFCPIRSLDRDCASYTIMNYRVGVESIKDLLLLDSSDATQSALLPILLSEAVPDQFEKISVLFYFGIHLSDDCHSNSDYREYWPDITDYFCRAIFGFLRRNERKAIDLWDILTTPKTHFFLPLEEALLKKQSQFIRRSILRLWLTTAEVAIAAGSCAFYSLVLDSLKKEGISLYRLSRDLSPGFVLPLECVLFDKITALVRKSEKKQEVYETEVGYPKSILNCIFLNTVYRLGEEIYYHSNGYRELRDSPSLMGKVSYINRVKRKLMPRFSQDLTEKIFQILSPNEDNLLLKSMADGNCLAVEIILFLWSQPTFLSYSLGNNVFHLICDYAGNSKGTTTATDQLRALRMLNAFCCSRFSTKQICAALKTTNILGKTPLYIAKQRGLNLIFEFLRTFLLTAGDYNECEHWVGPNNP